MLRSIVLKITAGARFIFNGIFYISKLQVGLPVVLDQPNMTYALDSDIDSDRSPHIVVGFDGTWIDGNGHTIRYTG